MRLTPHRPTAPVASKPPCSPSLASKCICAAMSCWIDVNHGRPDMKQASQGPGPSRLPVQPPNLSRREFLARGSAVAATSALAGVTIPWVHAAEDNTIRLALIGCGGRGSGARAHAYDSPKGPVKLVVMAD